jgi:glycosyltransferase involved in cell wall biosynthesis
MMAVMRGAPVDAMAATMPNRLRSVVHVLPHPGEGAETYLDVLRGLDGWDQDRVALSRTRTPARAAAAIARGYPGLVARARGADLVHAHGEVAAAACLPLLRARPSVWTTHGLHLIRRVHGAKRGAAVASLRAVVRAADRTICVAGSERDELVALLGHGVAERVVTVENGLPPVAPLAAGEREAARQELGLGEGEVVFVYVGQLEERKDPLAAARAATAARAGGAPVTLLLAGDGPLAPELAACAGEAVRPLGRRSDVPRLLAAADAFVLPSRREGLSYALLEAMGRGLAVVASDVPGNAEGVGDAGILVRAGDVAGFTEAFARLAGDPSERERLGTAARERVAGRFAAERMIAETRAVYDEVAGPDAATTGSRRAAS